MTLLLLSMALNANGDKSVAFFKPSKPKAWESLETHFRNFQFASIFGLTFKVFEKLHFKELASLQESDVVLIDRSEKQTRKTSSKSIKAMTCNMFLLPQPFANRHEDRISDLVKIVKKENPDLVALQEVWTNHWAKKIIELLPEYNATFSFNPLFNRSGLLSLSKFKINKVTFLRYPSWLNFRFEELLAGKGFLISEIVINGFKVNFVNTHLYSARREMRIKPNFSQLPLLTNYFKDRNVPTAICGDLNLTPNYVFKTLGVNFIQNKNLKPTAGNHLERKLDYILLKQGTAKINLTSENRILTPRISDHVPVIAKFKIEKVK